MIEEEFSETTSVQLSVYFYYLKSMGLGLAGLGFTFYVLFESAYVSENFWLSTWSDDPAASLEPEVRNFYMIGYGLLGGLETAFIFMAVVSLTIASNRASVKLHEELLSHILHSPMAFFDTTPTGRIVNRFSKDTDEADLMLPLYIKDFTMQAMNVSGVGIVLSIVSPIMIVVLLILVCLLSMVQKLYVKTSRQLKRLLSVSRSPINSHLEETLAGLSTIRAFGLQQAFEAENEVKIDALQMARYPEIISNCWLFLRLQFVGMFMIVAVALVAVLGRDIIDPGSVGLSLSDAIICQLDLFMLVRLTGDVEKAIVSVERIKEYQVGVFPSLSAENMPLIFPVSSFFPCLSCLIC
jgi:ABC-type multidrug transport system fused ATPase/permease subunit